MIGDMDINSIIEENRKLKKLKEEFNNISLDRLIRETEAIREMARQRDQAQETCLQLHRRVQKLESQLAKMTKKLQKAQSKGAKREK